MKRLSVTILGILAVFSMVAIFGLVVSPASPAMGAPPAPILSSPERGRQLDTPNVLFQWSDVSASTYHIVVFEIGDPTLIIQEATTPNTSITFRLFDDTYGWNVQATDALGAVGPVSETWYFQVLLVDSAPPEFTVTSPNGGEEIPGGSVFTITWAAVDDLTSIPNLKINIYLSTDGGAGWQSIAQQQPNDGAFAWQVPNINTTPGSHQGDRRR